MATFERRGERGFTLAAVLILLTIMLIFLAYTVPRMWSDVMKRERDLQTVWVMKQYARAIKGFADARKVYPTKLDDLKDQNKPRVLRQLYPNPLSGKMDWVLIPFGTPTGDQVGGAKGVTGPQTSTSTATTSTSTQLNPASAPGAQSGPFIGVRPAQKGTSFISLRGSDKYESWSYTTNELDQEIAQLGQQNPAAGGIGAPGPKRP